MHTLGPAIFYLLVGILFCAGIYWLSTLPTLPAIVKWLLIGASILVGVWAVLAFVAPFFGVLLPTAQ